MTARGNAVRGNGMLGVGQQEDVLGLLGTGKSQEWVARRYGVSRNVIAGVWRRHGEPVRHREPTTLVERCDRLHARFDAVLRATAGVGRLPNEPKMVVVR